MNEQPYANREIDDKLADIFTRFDAQDKTLSRIEGQTIKTNGRVGQLERWQSYVIGFCAAVSMLMLPVLFKLFIK